MLDSAQVASGNLNHLCLGVLISTPRHYVNIQAARLHLQFFLNEYVDEPVSFFYEKKDANALTILKGIKGYNSHAVSIDEIKKLNQYSVVVIHYNHGVNIKDGTFSEILCKRFRSLYTFDTNLRINYE